VSDSSGGRGVDEELEQHLAAAKALGELAESRLSERGFRASGSGYEGRYVDEICAISREFKLDYYGPR